MANKPTQTRLRTDYEHEAEVEGRKYYFAPLSLHDCKRLKHMMLKAMEGDLSALGQSRLAFLDPDVERPLLELIALGAAVDVNGTPMHLADHGPPEGWMLNQGEFTTHADMARQLAFLLKGIEYQLGPFLESLGALGQSQQASPTPAQE